MQAGETTKHTKDMEVVKTKSLSTAKAVPMANQFAHHPEVLRNQAFGAGGGGGVKSTASLIRRQNSFLVAV